MKMDEYIRSRGSVHSNSNLHKVKNDHVYNDNGANGDLYYSPQSKK